MNLKTNESYSLFLICDGGNGNGNQNQNSPILATIQAETIFGLRHSLETLSQLMIYDDVFKGVRLPCDVEIFDFPAFPYRGLSIDTVRHFYSIDSLKRLIDGMAMNKLNRFHWHLTDSQAFPFETKKQPNLTFHGAYDPEKIYRQSDVSDLTEYALIRGIQVIPEIDAPSHVGHGWEPEWTEAAGLGKILLCFARDMIGAPFGPPNGYLNPLNPSTYEILCDLFAELFDLTNKPDLFHIGGDEVLPDCWLNNSETSQWILEQNLALDPDGAHRLWIHFEKKFQDILKKTSGGSVTPIIWSSSLTNFHADLLKEKLGTDLIVEVWDSSEKNVIPDLLKKGFQIIVANYDAWYLDCGFGQWVAEDNNWCSPYKHWQLMYNNRPYKSLKGDWKIENPDQLKLILGGEGAMWSEEADENSLEMKVWPRLAAIAERLWTDPDHCWYFANGRMQLHRYRMVNRGFRPDAVQPFWCSMNEGDCIADPKLWSKFGWKTTCDEFQNRAASFFSRPLEFFFWLLIVFFAIY